MSFSLYTTVTSASRAPANLSRLQAAAAGAQWPGPDAAPLHGRSGEPALHQAAAPADTSDPLQLLRSVTDFYSGGSGGGGGGGAAVSYVNPTGDLLH